MAFEGHKGRKAKKGQEGQKNKYGSKCLELSNSARNAKIAKNFQKVPKAWRSMDIRPNGLWSWNYIYIYVRNIMLIFIHHNLLNTIFRKKLTQAIIHCVGIFHCFLPKKSLRNETSLFSVQFFLEKISATPPDV